MVAAVVKWVVSNPTPLLGVEALIVKGAVNEIEAFAAGRAEILDNKAAVDSAGSTTYHGAEGTRLDTAENR